MGINQIIFFNQSMMDNFSVCPPADVEALIIF